MTGLLALVPLVAGAATVLWARGNFLVAHVRGASMSPAHRPGDKVLVRRLPPGRIRPGDVVVADVVVTGLWPGAPGSVPGRTGALGSVRERVVKRVAAVPGDPVPAAVPRRADETSIPDGCFILLGDNSRFSIDSRHFGYVPAAAMIGKVVRPLASASRPI
ncbi:S26 family signal peptidase [Planobispora takensis]|uniref:S26 family signal peptidase n=1 Tax=Planobispora takensis TaxID=1367882 RepID=A0A8J3WW05_9ACTN|nr:S26 family signal peptidase [Planobispora takensis]GII04331.1 S26 family signal peptidase [Planobispora takensis]